MSIEYAKIKPINMIREDLLFLSGADIKTYKADEVIFEEGEFPSFYFQIKQGKVKLNNYNEDGKEFIHDISEEKQSFGDSFLFIERPYPMNAVAIEDCVIIKLSKSNFLNIIKENTDISFSIHQCLADRMYYKYIMLYNLSFQNPEAKLKLLMDYLKSYREDKSLYSFQIPMTRQQLASLTGLRVETVIRVIKNMEKNKQLQIKNRKIYY